MAKKEENIPQIPDTVAELLEKIDAPVETDEERKERILATAEGRHVIKRMVHSVKGHPREQVYWGSMAEGATCECGEHWTAADMRV
jgi:hypothetical protein